MAAQTRATLKNYFLGTPTYSVPTEANYADLIDSFLNLTDDGAASGYGLWRLDASSNLYYNLGTTKYWGIGTVTPTAKLHLVETADVPFVNIGNNSLSGGRAVVIGDGCSVSGDYSFAHGSTVDVAGDASFSHGATNTIGTASLSYIFGSTNSIGDTGTTGFIFGYNNTIGDNPYGTFCFGIGNTVGDNCQLSYALGGGVTITTDHVSCFVWNGSVAAATSKGSRTFFVQSSAGIYLKTGKLNFEDIPTASAGLVSGDVWNDSGTLKIIP